jgi:LysM repeat protein
MGAKLIAGLVGFVVIAVLLQSYVFGGDDDPLNPSGRSGPVPTATLPAQLPAPVVLAEVTGGGGSTQGGNSSGSGTYTVKSGETLGAIAASLNVPAEQQAAWIADVLRINAIADPRSIQSGQVLNLPAIPQASATPKPSATTRPSGSATARPSGTTASASPTATKRPSASPTATPRPSGGAGSYTVVSGDTLFGIADKCGIEDSTPWVNELQELNQLSDPADIDVGQVLELPAGTGSCE